MFLSKDRKSGNFGLRGFIRYNMILNCHCEMVWLVEQMRADKDDDMVVSAKQEEGF